MKRHKAFLVFSDRKLTSLAFTLNKTYNKLMKTAFYFEDFFKRIKYTITWTKKSIFTYEGV